MYERTRASDMIERMLDTCIDLELELQRLSRLYPSASSEIISKTNFSFMVSQYRQQEYQIRQIIEELRTKGV